MEYITKGVLRGVPLRVARTFVRFVNSTTGKNVSLDDITLPDLIGVSMPAEIRTTPITFLEAFSERIGQEPDWVAARIKTDAKTLRMALKPLAFATMSSFDVLVLDMEDVCETFDIFEAYLRHSKMTEEEMENEMLLMKRARRKLNPPLP